MSGYPKRGSHFAHRAVRLMFKVCLAQEIGTDAIALLTLIVHTEDAKRYSGPVTYYNAQIQSLLGISKWDRLNKARQSAIDAGWLHYDPPPAGTKKAGVYWVTVPKEYALAIDDAPSDEGPYPINGYGQGYADGYRAGYRAGEGSGDGRGDAPGEPSTLALNPSPSPPPPTPSPPSDHGSCADDPEWVEAVEAFAKIGLGSASSTAQESKQRGFRPRVVLAYVDYYRAHAWAWSAGAVRHVLREAPPNCPPQEAIWPKPREPDARAKEALAVLADCREYVAERGLKLAPEQFIKAFAARLEKRGLSDLKDESLCRERWAREGVRQ